MNDFFRFFYLLMFLDRLNKYSVSHVNRYIPDQYFPIVSIVFSINKQYHPKFSYMNFSYSIGFIRLLCTLGRFLPLLCTYNYRCYCEYHAKSNVLMFRIWRWRFRILWDTNRNEIHLHGTTHIRKSTNFLALFCSEK
jgi:hypothetical protein